MNHPLYYPKIDFRFDEAAWFYDAVMEATKGKTETYKPIAHFFRPIDAKEAKKAKKLRKTIIVSAFYAELCNDSSFLTSEGKLSASGRALLSLADTIAVPSLPAKEYLLAEGFEAKIIISPFPSDASRYEGLVGPAADAFYRAMAISSHQPYILGVMEGRPESYEMIKVLAEAFPGHKFIWMVDGVPVEIRILAETRILDNVMMVRAMPKDIILSAIRNADALLAISLNKPEFIWAAECAAAKTPFFSLETRPSLRSSAIGVGRTTQDIVRLLHLSLESGKEGNLTPEATYQSFEQDLLSAYTY